MRRSPATAVPAASLVLVFAGGGLGTGLRHLVGLAADGVWGTFGVNIVGAFALGWLLARLDDARWTLLRPLFGTGLLGAFTTYSTMALALADSPGAGAWAAGILSLLLGPAAAAWGLRVGGGRG